MEPETRKSLPHLLIVSALCLVWPAQESQAITVSGVVKAGGGGLSGAMVTARHLGLGKASTVFSDERGRYALRGLESGWYDFRARRLGFSDDASSRMELLSDEALDFRLVNLEREEWMHAAPAALWFSGVRFPSEALRAEFVIQCGMCHQQGNAATRIPRSQGDWDRVLDQMAVMGGVITKELRNAIPETLNSAFGKGLPQDSRPGSPPEEAFGASVTEWDLGTTLSMQHDIIAASDGRIYAVDMLQDKVFRLDPVTSERAEWDIPDFGAPPGGLMGKLAQRGFGSFRATPRLGPHSLQADDEGRIWITLSFWKGLARFDPKTESFDLFEQGPAGRYPHTLRFDGAGRIWYTLAVSNHIGRLDPGAERVELIDLPEKNRTQAFFMKTVRFWMAVGQWFSMPTTPIEDPEIIPIAYGIDVAPDGSVWFSQFNNRRIGRLEPRTGKIQMYDTPFYGPRRFRVAKDGIVWIPNYVDGELVRFDPTSEQFDRFSLPTPGDMPYALNVHPQTGMIWICGSNSDLLIRFDPGTEEFTQFPLPTRVTFCRDIDFDAEGNVWTSNSNLPGWHIEDRQPKVIRLSLN